MPAGELRAGDVIAYPYLWRWQKAGGETEGRKDRPVCVLVAVRRGGDQTHLALLAISSRPPAADQSAIEIPEGERWRGGLSDLKRAWIAVSEFNYDIAERSFFLDPRAPVLGRFSRSFLRQIAIASAPLFRDAARRIDRQD